MYEYMMSIEHFAKEEQGFCCQKKKRKNKNSEKRKKFNHP